MGALESYPAFNSPIVGEDKKVTPIWLKFFQTLWNKTGGGTGSVSGIGAGYIVAWPGPAVPGGWLECDGREISRFDYAALFDAIGETWGAGDGSKTFNLPNLADRFLRGSKVGSTGGQDEVSLEQGQIPSHTHPVNDPGHTHGVTDPGHGHGVTDPGHVHTITDPGHVHTSQVSGNVVTAGAADGGTNDGNTGSATTGITINSATTGVSVSNGTTGISIASATTGITVGDSDGGNDPVSTVPKYAGVTWIIKT